MFGSYSALVIITIVWLVDRGTSYSLDLPEYKGTVVRFPKDFIFGAASSAYQTEGAWNLSGKGESIWDRFTHTTSGLIADGSNGDVAGDSYHRYEEDVRHLKDIGFQMYKYSLSWSRILPKGTLDTVNKNGIAYYTKLLDALISNGIEPMVILYHWDLPQQLQDHGGWLNASIVKHFENYSRLMFQTFGSKVRWWITVEDPLGAASGYGISPSSAPGRPALHGFGEYRAGRHLLLAHAAAARIYREEFASANKGKISFSLKADYVYPMTDTPEDILAAESAMQFTVGWFGHPVYSRAGDYPAVMRDSIDRNSAIEELKQSRLPYFTRDEVQQIKGSADFLAFSHITSRLARFEREGPSPSWTRDSNIKLYSNESWSPTGCESLKVVPNGFAMIIKWFTEEYGDVPMFITGNGYCDHGDVEDDNRIQYYSAYLSELAQLKEEGFNILGYCTKSLIDSFEWGNGFRDRYGVIHVAFNSTARTRTPKKSAYFWKRQLRPELSNLNVL